jgi:lysophospholipase L1-like esterase
MFKPRKLYLVFMLTSMATIVAGGQILSKTIPVRFLALGDSYTIGESVAEVQRWPVQLIHALKKKGYACHNPDIVAVTGWRTDDLKKALNSGGRSNDYNLVSLLIGVNNQYQGKSVSEYEREFEGLLKMAIRYAGNDSSKVLVLSIPDYGFTPFGQNRQAEISAGIDSFNAANKTIAKKYGVTYINITDISRLGLKNPDLVASDGLHPSGKMYNLWVEDP